MMATEYRTRWRPRSRIELTQLCFWIFVLLLFLLPLERINGPMATKPVDAALVASLVVFWLIAWASRRRVVFPLLLPVWLILVASSLATLFSDMPAINILAMVQEVYLYFWFVSAVNLLAWLGKENMHRLNKIWIIVGCVESLLLLMGMLKIGPSFLYQTPLLQFRYRGFARSLGTFNNPNPAASYIMTTFFVLMATPWPRHLLLRLAVGGWLFLGIYATGSNGALAGELAGLIFYLLYRIMTQRDRQSMRLWITLGTLIAAVGVALPVVGFSFSLALKPGVGQALLATTVGRLSEGIDERIVILNTGWDMFSHNMLGVGPNSASEIIGGGGSLHNDYLAFLAERGVLGLMGLFLLIVLTMAYMVASVRLAHGHRVQQIQAIALGAGFVANFVNAAAHEVTHSRPLWLLMAMIFAYYYMLQQRVGQPGAFPKSNEQNQGRSPEQL